MFSLNTVFIIIASFVGGVFLKHLMLMKEMGKLKAQITQQTSETDNLRTTLSTKVCELNEMHSEMSKQHAAELIKHRDEHRLILATQENEAREKLRAAEVIAFNDGVRQSELRNSNYSAGFTVQVRPYVEKIRKEGIIFDDMYSAVGFQYQLLVNGIPCFQPHVVIEQKYDETEVNDERLKFLTEQAIKVAQLAIQATNAQHQFKFVESPLIADSKI